MFFQLVETECSAIKPGHLFPYFSGSLEVESIFPCVKTIHSLLQLPKQEKNTVGIQWMAWDPLLPSPLLSWAKMSKIAEKALVGQFRVKNAFDGSHAFPHNLSSFQEENQSVFYPPKVEKRQFLVVAKSGMYFLQRRVEEIQRVFSTMPGLWT